MKKFWLWCLGAALLAPLASCTKEEEGSWPGSDPADEASPEILFFDDFDSGEIPDPESWKLCDYAGVAWAQYFKNTDGYSNVRLENGCLVLTADKVNGLYRNGGVRTRTGFPAGTKVEVRARFDKALGGFPAIWQMPINTGGVGWPDSGEVDIMEWVQGTPYDLYFTVHSAYNQLTGGTGRGTTWYVPDFNTAFHTYGAARTEEAVIFYFDGKEIWRYGNEHLAGGNGLLQFPFANWDYDIILNYSLGGYLNGALTWPGAIRDSDLPASMYVDWVRVSRL